MWENRTLGRSGGATMVEFGRLEAIAAVAHERLNRLNILEID